MMVEPLLRKAVVLGNQLSVVQAIGANGIDCFDVNNMRHIASYSRYSIFKKSPDPRREENKAIEFLYDICQKEGNNPIVFPTNDMWAMATSKHKDKLLEVSTPCIADHDVVELLLNKEKFCKWGQERGFMTPRTWSLKEVSQIQEEDFPIAIKPSVHRTSTNEYSLDLHINMERLRLNVVNSKSELDQFLMREKCFADLLTYQEYVNGLSDCIYNVGVYVDRSSRILGSVCGHKIRGFPATHGDCILGENIDLPTELTNNVQRIIDELKYFGFAEFEYKRDSDTGKFTLIEINPRPWSWIGLTPACGFNLPLIAYQDLTGTYDPSNYVQFNGKVKFARVLKDIVNCFYYYRTDHPEWNRSPGEWIRDLKADKRVYYEFNADDWLVSAIMVADTFQKLVRHASRDLVDGVRGTPRSPSPEGLRPTRDRSREPD
jgi:D-aspartate ligase